MEIQKTQGKIEKITPTGNTTFINIGDKSFSDFKGQLSKDFKENDSVEVEYIEKTIGDKTYLNLKSMNLIVEEVTAIKPEITHTEKEKATKVIIGLLACCKIVALTEKENITDEKVLERAIKLRKLVNEKAYEIIKEEN